MSDHATAHNISMRRIRYMIRRNIATFCFVFLASSLSAAPQTHSNSSNDFQEAESLLQQRRFHEAKSAAEETLRHHPNSIEGYNLLGIIDTDLQDFNGAILEFQKALRMLPSSIKTRNNLGNLYVVIKRPDLAENEFRAALRNHPANADANYNLGVLLMDKRQFAAAIPHFERVRPPNIPTRLNLIRAYFEARRRDDAIRLAGVLASENESDVQVNFSLGLLLAEQKQYSEAQREFEKANAIQPNTFELLYNLGQVLLHDSQPAKAQLILNRVLNIKPDSVETMHLLAQAYTDESRPLDALDLLVRAHRLVPDNPDIVYLMAQISMSQGYFEDAIPLLEEALKVAPQRPDLLAILGEGYFMADKIDKAIDQFKNLLAVDKSARSYSFLGLSYRNLGRFAEAKRYFEDGLKLDPHNGSCLFNLGYIAEREGNAHEAEALLQEVLKFNPDFPDALLELANMQMVAKQYREVEELLRRYVRVSRNPAPGYYKLAIVERNLHETVAAEQDLNTFKSLSKNASVAPYPYQHLFDYLDNRSQLAPDARSQLDLSDLIEEAKHHPDQPQTQYLLADAYLKTGNIADARAVISQLDRLSAKDFRSLTGTGVLLARYRLYDDAIRHFEQALELNPDSDDVKFDLADAYFHVGQYSNAFDVAMKASSQCQKENAYLALLGDIYAHLGNLESAAQIFERSVDRNPDDDQAYLSLALIYLRQGSVAAARTILQNGQKRIPESGKLYWGLGVAAAMQDDPLQAARQLERAIELLPDWPAGYSTLGVLYFQSGQLAKARDVLDRFRQSTVNSSLDIDHIQQVLDNATPVEANTLTTVNKAQFLEFALSLADKTL